MNAVSFISGRLKPARCKRVLRPVLVAVLWMAIAAPFATPPAHAAVNRAQVAADAEGRLVRVDGSVVIVEPDIELSVITAGGLQEPRQEWSNIARQLFPAKVRAQLAGRRVALKPDFDVADDLDPASQLGQVLRLNQAVALSITQYSIAGSALATKRDGRGRARMDWSLGPGVAVLRETTGADYALFTYVRDSYATGGRQALRVLGIVVGVAMGGLLDIGGGAQVGVATLVDLRTGQVVWYNLLARQSGDLRDPAGADQTVQRMLTQLPVAATPASEDAPASATASPTPHAPTSPSQASPSPAPPSPDSPSPDSPSPDTPSPDSPSPDTSSPPPPPTPSSPDPTP